MSGVRGGSIMDHVRQHQNTKLGMLAGGSREERARGGEQEESSQRRASVSVTWEELLDRHASCERRERLPCLGPHVLAGRHTTRTCDKCCKQSEEECR